MRKIIFTAFAALSFNVFAATDEQIAQEGFDAYNAKEYEKAVALLTPLLQKNEPTALAIMGLAYEGGNGVTQNNKEAVKLMEAAYKAGWRGTIENNLGIHYQTGKGVDRNLKKAEEYFLLAGDDKYALRNLAEMYLFYPEFTSKANIEKAASFAKKSVEMGNGYASLIASTADCALSQYGSETASWDNSQHRDGFDVTGNVMRLSWDSYNLLFSKSGDLIYNIVQNQGTLTQYNSANRYYRDSDCRILRKDTLLVRTTDYGFEWVVSNRIEFKWSGNKITEKSAKGTNWDLATLQHFDIPDGSTFVIEKARLIPPINNTYHESISYKHRNPNGRLIWSDNGVNPYFDFIGLTLISSGSSLSPSNIMRDGRGLIKYNRGVYCYYNDRGQIERIVDHAAENDQEQGSIRLEYERDGTLKKASYSENYFEYVQHNVSDVRFFSKYKFDARHNWISRTMKYTFEGTELSPVTDRTIVYWN